MSPWVPVDVSPFILYLPSTNTIEDSEFIA